MALSDEPMMGKYKYKDKETGKIIITIHPIENERYELIKVLVKQKTLYGRRQSLYNRS